MIHLEWWHFQLTSPPYAILHIVLSALVKNQQDSQLSALYRSVGLWWYSKSFWRITAFNKSPHSIIHKIAISMDCSACNSSPVLPGHLGLCTCNTPAPCTCCCPTQNSNHRSTGPAWQIQRTSFQNVSDLKHPAHPKLSTRYKQTFFLPVCLGFFFKYF